MACRGVHTATGRRPGTLRWYWNGHEQSDHWLGDLSVGQEGK
jgi:hypothetical protein